MSIRTRLTLWYAGMLLGSLLLMGAVLRYELIIERERNTGEAPGEQIADVLLFYGMPTVIVLVLGGSWLMRRALRPIEALTATAERVHAGNLAERIPPSGRGDELDRLAEVFNAMLARVEAGIASVRDFTLHASHELKTPLTILSAETELALGDPATPASQRERLASQLEEVRRLAALVDALSLLAKADAGLSVIRREPLSLDELLRDAVADTRLLADRKGVSIELSRCDAAPFDGDRSRLRQALLNLLENAVKHNHPGGWMSVELSARPEAFTISIENTGATLPPDLIGSIFERFVRGSATAEGFGLGLSITKTIVEAHGGVIKAASRPEGGAHFCVCLTRSDQTLRAR